jgi:hypothetical protein
MPADTNPAFRPAAPNPAISRSSTSTRSPGSSDASEYAVHSPVKPAPTIATSTSASPANGGRGTSVPGSLSSHRLRAR